MNDHTVIENITQSGNSRTGQLNCSCGVKTGQVDLQKTPLRALRAELVKLHEAPKPKKQKKSKKQKTSWEKDMTLGETVMDTTSDEPKED